MLSLLLCACVGSNPTTNPTGDTSSSHTGTAETGLVVETAETGLVVETADTGTGGYSSGFGASQIPLVDGYLIIAYGHHHPPNSDTSFGIAQFWETTLYPTGISILPYGLDTCNSTVYTVGDLLGSPWEKDVLSAGTIQFTSAQGVSTPAIYSNPAMDNSYYQEVDTTTFSFDSLWTVTASGDEVPAFQEEVYVPPDVDVIDPSPQFQYSSGGMDVTWSGGNPNITLTIRVSTIGSNLQRGTAICEVQNDGSFHLPAYILDSLPSGVMTVQVEHLYREVREVSGLELRVEGVVTTLRIGDKL